MPIEIKELHIKAVVNESESGRGAESSAATPEEFNVQALIAECVEQVLEVLKEKEER